MKTRTIFTLILILSVFLFVLIASSCQKQSADDNFVVVNSSDPSIDASIIKNVLLDTTSNVTVSGTVVAPNGLDSVILWIQFNFKGVNQPDTTVYGIVQRTKSFTDPKKFDFSVTTHVDTFVTGFVVVAYDSHKRRVFRNVLVNATQSAEPVISMSPDPVIAVISKNYFPAISGTITCASTLNIVSGNYAVLDANNTQLSTGPLTFPLGSSQYSINISQFYTGLTEGSYQMKISAVDSRGRTVTAIKPFQVQSTPPAPTVAFDSTQFRIPVSSVNPVTGVVTTTEDLQKVEIYVTQGATDVLLNTITSFTDTKSYRFSEVPAVYSFDMTGFKVIAYIDGMQTTQTLPISFVFRKVWTNITLKGYKVSGTGPIFFASETGKALGVTASKSDGDLIDFGVHAFGSAVGNPAVLISCRVLKSYTGTNIFTSTYPNPWDVYNTTYFAKITDAGVTFDNASVTYAHNYALTKTAATGGLSNVVPVDLTPMGTEGVIIQATASSTPLTLSDLYLFERNDGKRGLIRVNSFVNNGTDIRTCTINIDVKVE